MTPAEDDGMDEAFALARAAKRLGRDDPAFPILSRLVDQRMRAWMGGAA